MIGKRRDLSAWVMHFIHNRNPENDPAYEINEGEETPLFPFHEDWKKNQRFDLWDMVDNASTIAPDDDAFSVLLKIIEDGHIRSGWSFRNGKPTIYGPRSACCFTEMPLYALIDYAQRRSSDVVGTYAICLLREELFTAGGRPVIYGLSGQHCEVASPHVWPRKLSPECGIAEHEQYRYVAMNFDHRRRIDWGHEREWRWADVFDKCSCPGLAIWLLDKPHSFSSVIIIVQNDDEKAIVLDKLKELYDARSHNFGYEYDLDTLIATRVVSLDEVARVLTPEQLSTIRLDDVPASTISKFSIIPVTTEYVRHVKSVLDQAHIAASQAAKAFIARAQKNSYGHVLDGCGFAHLVLYNPQSPLVSALLELGEATVIGGVGYWVSNFGQHTTTDAALGRQRLFA